MRLDSFRNDSFDRGAPALKELLWLVVGALLVGSWLPGSSWRIGLLRLFGAKLGKDVVIKPGFRVKFPWRLVVGNHCWLGERTWVDNLVLVHLGEHVCISQGAYLCTGSHDWSKESFDLIAEPISIASHSWLGARSIVGPGVSVGEGAVLTLGSVATRDLSAWTIHMGVPANPVKERKRGVPLGAGDR